MPKAWQIIIAWICMLLFVVLANVAIIAAIAYAIIFVVKSLG